MLYFYADKNRKEGNQMITLFLLIALYMLFVYVGVKVLAFEVGERSRKASKILDVILLIAPLIASLVFTILFVFVLEGRFYQRLSHAILVFALWLCAARFYWYLISFFKEKKILVLSLIGMIGCVVAAIVLTPLDRYVDLLHSFTRAASISVGDSFVITFYVLSFIQAKCKK
jgi:hypothetical protein